MAWAGCIRLFVRGGQRLWDGLEWACDTNLLLFATLLEEASDALVRVDGQHSHYNVIAVSRIALQIISIILFLALAGFAGALHSARRARVILNAYSLQ